MLADPSIIPACAGAVYSAARKAAPPTQQRLLLAAAGGIQQRLAGMPDRPIRRGGLSPRQLAQTIDYLMCHMAERVSVLELARLNRLSRPYFIRAFRDSTGATPHQWLMRARLRKARTLLPDDRLSIAAIAQAVGFADHAHFTRAFKRATGITPAAWRRQTRE